MTDINRISVDDRNIERLREDINRAAEYVNKKETARAYSRCRREELILCAFMMGISIGMLIWG
jgi:hypothetical protein